MNEYNQEFRVENDVLHVHLSGMFPEEFLRQEDNLFQPLINACLAQNSKKVLIDARDLQVHFDTMAMFRAGQDAALLSKIGVRIALLAREDMVDPFFDNVAYNRGAVIGIFTDMESASDWLGETQRTEGSTSSSR